MHTRKIKLYRVINMVELKQLKQLISFKKYRTLSKAAENLYISQPALSRSIQKLEKTLEFELFDRKKIRWN